MKIAESIISILEKVFTPKKHLGFSRNAMPQIEDEEQENFFKYLKSKGIRLKKTKMKIKDITPAQKEMRADVAKGLLTSGSPKLRKPLIVSSDNYLMDGHHRWLALRFEDENNSVTVIKVNERGIKLLDIMRNFGNVKYKDMT